MNKNVWIRTTEDLYKVIKHDKMIELLSDKFGLTER